jgi:chromosome segregation ATPase
MNRELNPQLFGGQRVNSNVDKIGPTGDPNQSSAGIMGRTVESATGRGHAAGQQVPYLSNEVKALEHQVTAMRVALMQMENRTEALNSKMEELSRSVHNRLERFSQVIQRIEENQSQQQQETTARFAQIAARVNERKIGDTKVQELVDRHNTIVRNFENRLLSLQRLVSEQEMALHNAQASLEEARSEIIRLKRL